MSTKNNDWVKFEHCKRLIGKKGYWIKYRKKEMNDSQKEAVKTALDALDRK